ncbi:MAG: hypothetical protein OT477_11805 [Chloroflexi bacterium]|nr:hypothetical protein [Chloroflexota bacterium]
MSDPRIRTLLRQAHKTAENGKRTAAVQLYRQILEEAPDTADAWAGLGNVLPTAAEQEAAYQRALELEPQNQLAQTGLAKLHNPTPEPEPEAEPAPYHPALEPLPEDKSLTCYRHPETETALRCNRCAKPICMKCAKRTSVGYRCPDCIRELEAGFYTAENSDYVLASIVSLFLSLIAGVILLFVGGGYFLYIIIFMAGGAGGSLVARLTSYAIGRRRGRYIPHLVAAAVVIGAILPSLCISGLVLIGIFMGGDSSLAFAAFGPIIAPLLYSAIAASAAYYWLK